MYRKYFNMYISWLLKKNSKFEPAVLHFGQSIPVWSPLCPVPESSSFQWLSEVWKLRWWTLSLIYWPWVITPSKARTRLYKRIYLNLNYFIYILKCLDKFEYLVYNLDCTHFEHKYFNLVAILWACVLTNSSNVLDFL